MAGIRTRLIKMKDEAMYRMRLKKRKQMLLDLSEMITKHKLKITGAVIVGAHEFREHKEYEKNGITKIMLIEPSPATFKILMTKFEQMPDYWLVNVACGPKTERGQMYVETDNNGQSNSLLPPKRHTDLYPSITFDSVIPVDVYPLDLVMQRRKEYNFLSLDVQCYEMEVLKGATETLAHIDYIMSEVNKPGAELYEGCTDIYKMDAYLKPFGFVRVEEPQWIGGAWSDSLWIKRRAEDDTDFYTTGPDYDY